MDEIGGDGTIRSHIHSNRRIAAKNAAAREYEAELVFEAVARREAERSQFLAPATTDDQPCAPKVRITHSESPLGP
jgi:hypothetical protein